MIAPQVLAPTPPNEVYAVFAGGIDQNTVQRFFQGVAGAMGTNVTHIHCLFQSTGGTVSDGVALYNFFRALPIGLTLYNVGCVASAAVIAFLGAKERKTSAHATFMIHKTYSSPQMAFADRLEAITHSLRLDDERTEAILRQHLTLPEASWSAHRLSELWLSANDALEAKLATAIAEFAPPMGTRLFGV